MLNRPEIGTRGAEFQWLQRVGRVLADILAGGPTAIRQQKALMRDWEALTPDAAIAGGIDCFAESWRTTEPTERMTAFLAGRRKA